MHKFWKFYFIFFIVWELYTFGFLLVQDKKFDITQAYQIIPFIGLIGLVFQKKVLWKNFWKFVFVASIVFHIHGWIMMPFYLHYKFNLSYLTIIKIQVYSLPLIPLIISTFWYAWKSEGIWNLDT